MIDINIIRTNRKLVEDNLKKKYQEEKLPILDEIIELDKKVRELKINGVTFKNKVVTATSYNILGTANSTAVLSSDLSTNCYIIKNRHKHRR